MLPFPKEDTQGFSFAMIKEKRNLSNTTMHELHGIVKRVFSKAVDYDIILRNPCDKIKAPRKSDPDRKSLQVEDAVKLLAFVDEYERNLLEEFNQKEERQDKRGNSTNRSYINGLVNISSIMAVRIAIATGMRRGEVLGLMWKDISFGDVCELKVRRAYTPALKLKEPKTKSGFRTIAIDRVTAEHLKAWKTLQAECLETLGESLMQTRNPMQMSPSAPHLHRPLKTHLLQSKQARRINHLTCGFLVAGAGFEPTASGL